jgi:hypothetical protein
MIRGIVFESVSDKLIVEATPADVAKLIPGSNVAVMAAPYGQPAPVGGEIVGETLFDKNGRAVAIVTGLSLQRDQIDITAYGDASPQYIYGAIRKQLTVEAIA